MVVQTRTSGVSRALLRRRHSPAPADPAATGSLDVAAAGGDCSRRAVDLLTRWWSACGGGSGQSPRPASRARRTASAWSVTWSFAKTLDRWFLTVLGARASRDAI